MIKIRNKKIVTKIIISLLIALSGVGATNLSYSNKHINRASATTFINAGHLRALGLTNAEINAGNPKNYGITDSSNITYNNYLQHQNDVFQQNQNASMKQFMRQRAKDKIPLKWNTRDLGDYKTNDGGITKTGIVYRSSKLTKLTPANIKELQKMGVTKVIDLRQYGDRKHSLDTGENVNHNNNQAGQVPNTNIQYEQYPLYTGKEHKIFKHIANFYGMSSRVNAEMNGVPAVDNKQAKKSYRNIFTTIINNKGATLFHCDAGHDRTGVTTALILSLVGVSRKDIIKDYLLTAYYSAQNQHKNVSSKQYIQQYNQISTFLNTIQSEYGSINNYLEKGVGLTSQQLSQLHNKLVTK